MEEILNTWVDYDNGYHSIINAYKHNIPLLEQVLIHINQNIDDTNLRKVNENIFDALDGTTPKHKHVKMFKNVLKVNPSHHTIPLKLAGYYKEHNKHEETCKYYKLSIANGDMFGMYYFGCYWQKAGNNQKAYKYFKMGTLHGSYLSAIELETYMNNYEDVILILLEFVKGEFKKCKTLEKVDDFVCWLKRLESKDILIRKTFKKL